MELGYKKFKLVQITNDNFIELMELLFKYYQWDACLDRAKTLGVADAIVYAPEKRKATQKFLLEMYARSISEGVTYFFGRGDISGGDGEWTALPETEVMKYGKWVMVIRNPWELL